MFPISDPILAFTFLITMILLAPLIAGRLRVPDMIFLLAGGALLGPNGLGMIERDSAITMFGSIGLLYIMFVAGLEIDFNRFIQSRNRSIVFGLLTFAFPMTAGTLLGHYLLGFGWVASILLASMCASHTLLAYPIASRLGIARRESVVISVGGTIVTDTLALLILAVIAESARGADLGMAFWGTLGLGMAAFLLLIVWGVPKLTHWFFGNVTESGSTQFLFILVVVCGCAYLAHFAKLEPILGAFAAGVVLNRLIPRQSTLMNRLLFVGNTLFIPFFLISVGMLVNLGVLFSSPRGWLVITSISCCIITTKYAAASVTRRLFHYNKDEGKVIFGLSVVQAAATLATVIVGYNLKIFDEHVLNGAIVSILVSCPLGAWVVDRYGRRLADREAPVPEQASSEQRLLVPIANQESSMRLLNLSFLIRSPGKPGGIYPVTIVNDMDNTDEAVARAEKLLAQCLTQGAAAEMAVTPSVRVDLNPSDGLVRTAQELRATQILAGWSRKSLLESRLFGTVAENLLNTCPPRLLFCHLERPLNLTKRILVPFPALAGRRTDLVELLGDIKQLATQTGAVLRVYLVADEDPGLKYRIEKARPKCQVSLIEGKTWSELHKSFLNDIAPEDLIVIPGERRSGAFWTPAVDKLQRTVLTRFPHINLLSSYPPLESPEQAEPETKRLKPEIFFADIPDNAGSEDALRHMAGKALGEEGDSLDTVMPLLSQALKNLPLELAEGLAFIHVHTDRIDRPAIVIGRSETERQIAGLRGTYRVLFMLINSEQVSAEDHLAILAGLAQNFLDRQFAEQVRSADSVQSIAAMLEGRS